MTTKQMAAWLTKAIGDRHFPIVMIDRIILGDHTMLIALGLDTAGKKQVLGLREGDTENSCVAKVLLRDLVERGLDPERARLFVIEGAKALRSAARKILGELGIVQRCQLHKQRNTLGQLPDGMHESVKAIVEQAWALATRNWRRHGSGAWPPPSKTIIRELLHRCGRDSRRPSTFKVWVSIQRCTERFEA